MARSPNDSAFLAHIVSQLENQVDFLVKHRYISHEDASTFLAKLPSSMPTFPTPTPQNAVFASAHAPTPPPPPPSSVPQARVLWAWAGQDSGDLSLAQGEIIEIIQENNPDWWTGRAAGRQGLFPASYVEKIQAPTPINEKPIEKPVYKPFRAAYHGMNQPPASFAPMPPGPPGPPGQSNVVVAQEVPQKEGKYGDLKKTMANSAAGGVGFGAGAAIGSGLINAIF